LRETNAGADDTHQGDSKKELWSDNYSREYPKGNFLAQVNIEVAEDENRENETDQVGRNVQQGGG
jgi:hypothetical protein